MKIGKLCVKAFSNPQKSSYVYDNAVDDDYDDDDDAGGVCVQVGESCSSTVCVSCSSEAALPADTFWGAEQQPPII